jgi:hypothetical protein
MKQIDLLSTYYSNNTDTLSKLSHLRKNIELVKNSVNREEVLFENFHAFYESKHLENTRSYGFFGLFHIFQYRVNGNHPLASKIRQSDLGLDDKILSFNFILNDSYMVMPSSQLPEFMRDNSQYTKKSISAKHFFSTSPCNRFI